LCIGVLIMYWLGDVLQVMGILLAGILLLIWLFGDEDETVYEKDWRYNGRDNGDTDNRTECSNTNTKNTNRKFKYKRAGNVF